MSPAERTGLCALAAAALLGAFHPLLALPPLLSFLGVCAVMPFFPGCSFFFPVIGRGNTGKARVGLSFDDGPDPEVTPRVLQLLQRYGVTATFFVTGAKAERHPGVIRAILAGGHAVGHHSYSHDDYLMFRCTRVVVGEIEKGQRVFASFGFRALFFRPPVGILTPRYAAALRRTGMTALTFSRRAGDMGNRRIRGLSRRILRGLRGDDIILLHDVTPPGGGGPEPWLSEVEAILQGIGEMGLTVVSLEELTGCQAMVRLPSRRA